MKLKYQMELLEIDGSIVAVPVDSDNEFTGVLHMNGTAADILEILKNDVTEDDVVRAMSLQYDATEEDIRRNVQKIVAALRENSLLCE